MRLLAALRWLGGQTLSQYPKAKIAVFAANQLLPSDQQLSNDDGATGSQIEKQIRRLPHGYRREILERVSVEEETALDNLQRRFHQTHDNQTDNEPDDDR